MEFEDRTAKSPCITTCILLKIIKDIAPRFNTCDTIANQKSCDDNWQKSNESKLKNCYRRCCFQPSFFENFLSDIIKPSRVRAMPIIPHTVSFSWRMMTEVMTVTTGTR